MNRTVLRVALRVAAAVALLALCGLLFPVVARDPDDRAKRSSEIPLHLDHIFRGGINRHGDLVGLHHAPSAPMEMRVDGKTCKVEFVQTSPGGKDDVVTAKVQLRDPLTGKVVREKFSTLFPAAWSKQDIEVAVREAYAEAKRHGGVNREGRFQGHARNVRIDGYLTRDGDAIATAFPVYQPPRSERRRP